LNEIISTFEKKICQLQQNSNQIKHQKLWRIDISCLEAEMNERKEMDNEELLLALFK
jgi:hypothetical protein